MYLTRVPTCVYMHWEILGCQDDNEDDRWVSAVKGRASLRRQRPLEVGGPPGLTQPEQKEVRYPNNARNWRWRSPGPVMKSTGPSRSHLNLSPRAQHIRKGQVSDCTPCPSKKMPGKALLWTRWGQVSSFAFSFLDVSKAAGLGQQISL